MSITQMQEIAQHCSRYKICNGCPLVGQCVAPLADAGTQKWNEWIELMHSKIVNLTSGRK